MSPLVATFLKSLRHIWGYDQEHGALDIHARSSDGHTPLHFAVRYNNLEVAAALLDEGANPNATDGDSYTPLHWAVAKGNLPLVRLLLDHAATLNIRNIEGKTPEEYALMRKNTELAELIRAERCRREAAQPQSNPHERSA